MGWVTRHGEAQYQPYVPACSTLQPDAVCSSPAATPCPSIPPSLPACSARRHPARHSRRHCSQGGGEQEHGAGGVPPHAEGAGGEVGVRSGGGGGGGTATHLAAGCIVCMRSSSSNGGPTAGRSRRQEWQRCLACCSFSKFASTPSFAGPALHHPPQPHLLARAACQDVSAWGYRSVADCFAARGNNSRGSTPQLYLSAARPVRRTRASRQVSRPLPPPDPHPARYNKLEVLAVAHRKFGSAGGLAAAKAAAGVKSAKATQTRKSNEEARK